MTRSLLMAVLTKSWDKKRREWASEPLPRLVEPATLMAVALGCTDPTTGGYMAKEVTTTSANDNGSSNKNNSHVVAMSEEISSQTPIAHKIFHSPNSWTITSPQQQENKLQQEQLEKQLSQNHDIDGQDLLHDQHGQYQYALTQSEFEFKRHDININRVAQEDVISSYFTNATDSSTVEHFQVMTVLGVVHTSDTQHNIKKIASNKSSHANDTHISEEKKSEEPVVAIQSTGRRLGSFLKRSFGKPTHTTGTQQRHSSTGNSTYITDEDGPSSVTASLYEASVAASGITIPRTNTSKNKLTNDVVNVTSTVSTQSSSRCVQLKKESESTSSPTNRRKHQSNLYSDKDWEGPNGKFRHINDNSDHNHQSILHKEEDIFEDETDDFDAVLLSESPLQQTQQEQQHHSCNKLLSEAIMFAAVHEGRNDSLNSATHPDKDQKLFEQIQNVSNIASNHQSIITNISSTSSTGLEDDSLEENLHGRYGPNYGIVQQQRNRRPTSIEEQKSIHTTHYPDQKPLHNALDSQKTRLSKDSLKHSDPLDRLDHGLSNANNSSKGYALPNNFKIGNDNMGIGQDNVVVEQTYSGTSLEYSTDGSSLFIVNEQNSTNSLIGQNLLNHLDGTSLVGIGLSKTTSSHDSDIVTMKKNKRNIALHTESASFSGDDENDSLLRDTLVRNGDAGSLSLLLNSRNTSSVDHNNSLLHLEANMIRFGKSPMKQHATIHTNNTKEKQNYMQQKKDQQDPQKEHQQQKELQCNVSSIEIKKLTSLHSREDTDSTANLSLQESESYTTAMSVIPTDEELFAIGWAKAFDPSSGNYYYFTLDRSKTVWENPLSGTQDGNSSAWSNSDIDSNNIHILSDPSPTLVISPRNMSVSPCHKNNISITQQNQNFHATAVARMDP